MSERDYRGRSKLALSDLLRLVMQFYSRVSLSKEQPAFRMGEEMCDRLANSHCEGDVGSGPGKRKIDTALLTRGGVSLPVFNLSFFHFFCVLLNCRPHVKELN